MAGGHRAAFWKGPGGGEVGQGLPCSVFVSHVRKLLSKSLQPLVAVKLARLLVSGEDSQMRISFLKLITSTQPMEILSCKKVVCAFMCVWGRPEVNVTHLPH